MTCRERRQASRFGVCHWARGLLLPSSALLFACGGAAPSDASQSPGAFEAAPSSDTASSNATLSDAPVPTPPALDNQQGGTQTTEGASSANSTPQETSEVAPETDSLLLPAPTASSEGVAPDVAGALDNYVTEPQSSAEPTTEPATPEPSTPAPATPEPSTPANDPTAPTSSTSSEPTVTKPPYERPELVVTNPTPEDTWETSCDGFLIHNKGIPQDYPPTFTPPADAREQFDQGWQDFLSTTGIDSNTYEPFLNELTLAVGLKPQGVIDWTLYDPAGSDTQIQGEINQFFARWGDLFGFSQRNLGPLEGPGAGCTTGSNSCTWMARYTQDYCGLSLVNGGFVYLRVNHDEGKLVQLTNSTVPMVPVYADANFTNQQLLDSVIGMPLEHGCPAEVIPISESWDVAFDEEVPLQIQPTAAGDSQEYRMITTLRGTSPGGGYSARIVFDIVDGSILEKTGASCGGSY